MGVPVLGASGALFADTTAQRNWTLTLAAVGVTLCAAVLATGEYWHTTNNETPGGLMVLTVTVPTAGVAIYLLVSRAGDSLHKSSD